MASGRVESIFLHKGRAGGEPMAAVGSAEIVVAGGLVGDRFYKVSAVPGKEDAGREVTLIEAEAIEAVVADGKATLTPASCRRNIVTRGVALNHLVGREFRVGEVVLRGVRLCEPCKHLEAMTERGMLMALLHRGGLRAQVVEGGEVAVGDPIELPDPAFAPVAMPALALVAS